jgi:hypothetical protein
MRELLRHVRKEVIESCLKAISAARQRNENEDKRAKTDWERAQSQLNQRRAENHKALGIAQSQYDSLIGELQKATQQVNEHFKLQRVPQPILPMRPVARNGSAFLESATNSIAAVNYHLQELLNVKRPEMWWWRNDDFFIASLTGGFLAVAIGMMSKPRRMGDYLPIAFLIIGITAVGIMAAIAVWRKNSVTAKLYSKYASWAQQQVNTEYWLSCHINKAIEINNQAVVSETLLRSEAEARFHQALVDARDRYQHEMETLRRQYGTIIDQARHECSNFAAQTGYSGLPWNNSEWFQWSPPSNAALAVSFGSISTGSYDMRPAIETPNLEFVLPSIISFESGRCFIFKATGEAKKRAIEALQSMMLRLLATTPPGKLRFTFIDPVGLGDNVAAFMPLGDYDKDLITSKAWTEPQHIEKRLAEMTEHMETVIQKFLRKKFPTIEAYNDEAGEVAEPYRILVVVDFPVNFSEASARRLVSIAQNGPRCGVHTYVVMDTSKPKPHGFNIEDLEHVATVISYDSNRFVWNDAELKEFPLELDIAPPIDKTEAIIKKVGSLAKSGMKVEVPYTKLLDMARADENYWWRDGLWQGSTSEEIKVPLGPTGARKPHYLTLGTGTAIHALIIGRTGSGKSNLMHVIITSLALAYSPEEMQLYLIDFKQGVEFKPYAEKALPHARVIAIQSEREFGMSVLQGLDDELRRRGDTFRAAGVEKISNYRQKTGEKMPRILLMVDEFQEFFSQDDSISRSASLIIDRLVRQGRSAGIHVMLGSQTLGGSTPLSRSTLGQMNVRIALQCSEADSRLILAEDNPAARLLSRPGEAYYNDQGGLVEGNTLFQVALFTDQDREMYLRTVNRKADGHHGRPIIFEGNKPARLEDCRPLNEMLAANEWPPKQKVVNALLGEAIAIRPPTVASFRRQSGNNLLVITRDEEEGIGILTSSIISIAAQLPADDISFYAVDFSTPDSEWEGLLNNLSKALPHRMHIVGRRGLPELVASLAEEAKNRLKSDRVVGAEIYLIIQGLHRARDLRPEEPGSAYSSRRTGEEKRPSTNEHFMTLLREGPDVGLHVIAWSDTLTNALRVERRLLTEFSLRVGAAMSNEDSTKLLDDSAASRLDKPHRAYFVDEERPGVLEKFRPYAVPEKEWLQWATRQLAARVGLR